MTRWNVAYRGAREGHDHGRRRRWCHPSVLLVAGVGFVLGSKAGNGPYQQIAAKVRDITKRSKPGLEAKRQPAGSQTGSADTACPRRSPSCPLRQTRHSFLRPAV